MTRLDVAIVQALLVLLVGYLFYTALLAMGQREMARLMKLAMVLVLALVIVVPVRDAIYRAGAWISGTVDRITAVTDTVEEVTEKAKDPKKAVLDILREQLRDPSNK